MLYEVITLDPPPLAPEPYRFMMLDWNPQGHQPPGVYTVPHFDFHFYMVPDQLPVPQDASIADDHIHATISGNNIIHPLLNFFAIGNSYNFV